MLEANGDPFVNFRVTFHHLSCSPLLRVWTAPSPKARLTRSGSRQFYAHLTSLSFALPGAPVFSSSWHPHLLLHFSHPHLMTFCCRRSWTRLPPPFSGGVGHRRGSFPRWRRECFLLCWKRLGISKVWGINLIKSGHSRTVASSKGLSCWASGGSLLKNSWEKHLLEQLLGLSLLLNLSFDVVLFYKGTFLREG